MPSTVIKKYDYFPEKMVLRVEFLSGKIYDYLEVPKIVYDEFRGAYSKGQFLNKKIKGCYPFKKMI